MPHNVLCVDDDRNLCQIMAKALTGEGYAVRTARDGEEALAAFQAAPPDLVLLDLLLPRRDGFGVLEAIRALPAPMSETPAILLSGCSRTPEYEERAGELRANAFLTKPVPLDLLLDSVRRELDGKAAPAVAPSRLAGSLAELPFPALLHQLHGLRATGALVLRSGKKRKGVQLRDGRPVAVKSNLVSECLGNLLIRMGRIDDRSLRESLQRMQRGEGLQGEILVAMQVLEEDELVTALRIQSTEKLFEIFEWSDGQFEFARGGRIQGASALPHDHSAADVIVGGVRSRFPLERVDAFLRANGDARIVASEMPFYRYQEIDLGPGQERMLERLAKSPRVRDLLPADEDSRRLLYGMLAAELVQLDGSNGPARAVHAGAAPDSAAAAARARLAAAGLHADPEEAGIRSELAALADRMRGADFFDVLGVAREATDADVRRSYVDLAKRTHPDRFSGRGEAIRRLAEEVFGLVSQAHQALEDAAGRERYRAELVQGARLDAELDEGRRALGAEQLFQHGVTALRAKSFGEALQAFRKAVEVFPEEGEYLAFLGWCRYLGAPDDGSAVQEAVRVLRRAAKLAPDSEKPYLFLGQLYKGIGHAELAERMFVRAVQQNSDCVEALRELRLINLRREKQRKGLVRRFLRR
jgi:CheY-like chemotaxis protein/tetratricopeptide (TPR) repeat protein